MVASQKNPNLVVIQLIGANDPLNTIIPYSNSLYYDFRPNVHMKPEEVLPINDDFGFTPPCRSHQGPLGPG